MPYGFATFGFSSFFLPPNRNIVKGWENYWHIGVVNCMSQGSCSGSGTQIVAIQRSQWRCSSAAHTNAVS